MSNIQLANNLRHLRKQHELTQKDLSRMLNISRQAYSNYETSKRTPDLDTLLYLSRFYHISLDTLVLRNLADTSPLPVFTERRPASYLLGKDKKPAPPSTFPRRNWISSSDSVLLPRKTDSWSPVSSPTLQ